MNIEDLTDDEIKQVVVERSLLVGWTCFHCGRAFTDPAAAERHFGATPKEVALCLNSGWQDKDDEATEGINAAHPMKTGQHDTYMQALGYVSNRHSKYALVALVNWLLWRLKRAGAE